MNWFHDVRFALRMLRKTPGFAAVSVLALALGIGANSVMFSALKGAVLEPFPFPQSARLMSVYGTRPSTGSSGISFSAGDYLDLRAQSRSFSALAAVHGIPLNLSTGQQPERLEAYEATPEFFSVLGGHPLLGRTVTERDAGPGRIHAVDLSYRLWQRHFAADPAIVGKTIVLDGQQVAVAGIMPEELDFPLGVDVWAPFSWTAAEQQNRENHYLDVIGRLRDGVTREQAQAELNTLAAVLAKQYPATNTGMQTQVISMIEDMTEGQRQFISVLMGAAVFVLLLACANVANLQLARATVRAREMAVRSALGASRTRLVRQLLAENIVLAIGGGLAGLLVGAWGIDLTVSQIPPFILAHVAGLRNIKLDGGVVAFTAVATLATGLISGIIPAIGSSSVSFNEALKEGGRGSEGPGRHRSRAALVVTEMALALVLLVCAGLMVQGFRGLMNADMGMDTRNLLTFQVRLPKSQYATQPQIRDFAAKLQNRLSAIPGVESAATMSNLPSGGVDSTYAIVEGAPPMRVSELPNARLQVVSPSLLPTLKLKLLRGRWLSDSDGPDTTPVVVVSDLAARTLWPGQEPLGRRVKFGPDDKEPWRTVVGIVADIRSSPFNNPRRTMFQPFAQMTRPSFGVVVRTAGDPLRTATAARQALKEVDASIPAFDLRSLEQRLSDNTSGVHISAQLMMAFGGIALVLAAAGIFAVMAYSVRQRTREIGVRVALGAQRADVLRLVLGYGVRMSALGIAIGLVVSLAVTKLLTSFLLGVIHFDSWAMVVFSLLLAAVAAAAALIPARWAMRVDPMVALRYE